MRKKLAVMLVSVWVSLWLAASAPGRVHAQSATPPFESAACPPFISAALTVECGFLSVPEDRAQPEGKTIRLAVAVIKSQHPNARPDPLLVINGGPGAHALTGLNRFLSIFHPWLTDHDRDVVIFDQRGVGLSEPALNCPELTPMLIAQAHGTPLTLADIQAPYRTCRDRWMGAGVNLAAYTTAASAADIHDLWRALGYTEVNLYGVSYGTLLAQTVMRDHPAGIRSVILDSAYPLESNMHADLPENIARGLAQVFAACAADALCNLLYPDLEKVLLEVYTRLEQTPALLQASDPQTGESFTFTFGALDWLDTVKSTPFRALPALMYEVREGDYATIVKRRQESLQTTYQYGPPPHRAMAHSVFCSQGTFYLSPEQINVWEDTLWQGWAKREFSGLFALPCDQWAVMALDTLPALSPIPTLILQGDYDFSVTPAYAELFKRNLPNAQLITVPNTGHGVLTTGNGCVNTIGRAFLNAPTVAPNTACLATVGQPNLDAFFTVRAAATRGLAQAGVLIFGGLLGVVALIQARAAQRAAHPLRFTWPHLNRRMILTSAGALGLSWMVARLGWVSVPPENVGPLLLPLLAALFAVYTFSPEDEPCLEILLAMPRPLAVLIIERIALLIVTHSMLALVFNGLTSNNGREPMMWFAPMLWLSSLALCLTLITRRAVMSMALTTLVWFAATVFGAEMILRWPFMWPIHLFLEPNHPFYALNRALITLTGLGLLTLALTYLLRDEESLLLGASRRTGGRGAQWAAVLPNDFLHLSGLPYPLAPLWAMVRYEFLINWRRASFFILVSALLTTPVLGALIETRNIAEYANAASAELGRARLTNMLMMITWVSVGSLCLFLLPVLVADVFSKDRQWGIYEVLESLPLPSSLYLVGKILSVWVSVSAVLLLVGIASAIAWRLVGTFNAGIVLEMWLLGVWPIALSSSTLVALLASSQPTNRRAVLIGVLLATLALAGQVTGYFAGETWWNYWNPGRPVLMLYYLLAWPGVDVGQAASMQRLNEAMQSLTSFQGALLTQLAGGVQVALVWLWVWWKNFRS